MKQSNKKKFSVTLEKNDIEYLDYVAVQLDITRGELARIAINNHIQKLKCVYGVPTYTAKFSREPQ